MKYCLLLCLMVTVLYISSLDEWSMEDKVLFEQAFGSHGKSFKRIQQMVN